MILRGFSEKWCVYQAGAAVEFPGESAWRIYRVMGQRAESRSPARRGRYPRPGPQGRLNLETTDDADASRLFTVTLPPTSGTPFPDLGDALPPPRGRPSPTSGTPFPHFGDALHLPRGCPSPTSGMPFPHLGDALSPACIRPTTSMLPPAYRLVSGHLQVGVWAAASPDFTKTGRFSANFTISGVFRRLWSCLPPWRAVGLRIWDIRCG